MTFSFFDHTGDIGVTIAAPTVDALFADAAAALADAMTDRSAVSDRVSRDLHLEAGDLDLLLVDWLREALYEFEAHELLLHHATAAVHRGEQGWVLRGTFSGERFDDRRHGIKVLIKAVTYHALDVRETPDGWSATVIFDI
jgi:SHS2 domain-containing protein